jgi:hypothetical protein
MDGFIYIVSNNGASQHSASYCSEEILEEYALTMAEEGGYGSF